MAKRDVAGALGEIDKRLDSSILSAEDRAQIKAKAREHVNAERRKKAEAEYLAKSIREIEIEDRPTEQYEDIVIDIPPFVAAEKLGGSCITLDGKMFFHGLTYNVPYSVARVLEDVMARGWEHENEIHGRRRRSEGYRRQINQHIRPGDEGVQSRVNTRSSLNENTSV